MHGSTVFLVAFLTSALTATGTVYLVERNNLFHLRPEAPAVVETVVPDLKGFSEADARANAQSSRITLIVQSREPSGDTKPGAVIRQSIPAGQKVPQQHPVSVVLAEELPKVPSLKGLPLVDATKRAEERGFKVEAGATVPDANVPEGRVANQTPDPDATLEKGKTISVQLSSGAGEAPVPKVVGYSVANAKKAIEKAGFETTVRWVSLAETPTYVVLNQKPPANEKAKAGTKVEIVVNQ
jgi:eukaryotic-like serine/threonine-protein kinase